jgi:hypothetical protein
VVAVVSACSALLSKGAKKYCLYDWLVSGMMNVMGYTTNFSFHTYYYWECVFFSFFSVSSVLFLVPMRFYYIWGDGCEA